MFKIDREELPVPEAELRAALARYKAQLEAHRKTVGVPKPFPEFDVLINVVEQGGGDFEVYENPALRPVAPPPTDEQWLQIHTQRFLNEAANAAGYYSIETAVSYADDPTVPKYQAEGQAFRRKRALAWKRAYEILDAVRAGAPRPTWEELAAELAVIDN